MMEEVLARQLVALVPIRKVRVTDGASGFLVISRDILLGCPAERCNHLCSRWLHTAARLLMDVHPHGPWQKVAQLFQAARELVPFAPVVLAPVESNVDVVIMVQATEEEAIASDAAPGAGVPPLRPEQLRQPLLGAVQAHADGSAGGTGFGC